MKGTIPCSYKKIILILTLFINSTIVWGQLKITGTVIDTVGTPLVYATVKLLANNTAIQTTSSDSIGNFSFTGLANGEYRVEGSYIGAKEMSKVFRLNKDTSVMIVIIQSKTVLKTVKVTANKPLLERKIDRLVFNVENSIAAKGTDLSEAIALTPLVKVDDNGISIVGKSGVSVMINDRILNISGADLVNYLKSLRSDDVAKIEVITAPPSKYEAHGNSGLINIVLKKNPVLGWSGNVSSSYSQGIYPSLSDNLNLNYQSHKLSSSLKLRQYNRKSYITEATDDIGATSLLSSDPRINKPFGIGANVGVDYKISKRSSAGFIYDIGETNSRVHSHNTNVYQTNDHTDSVLTTISNNTNPATTQTLNVYFDHKLDSNSKTLSAGFNFFSNTPETKIDFETESDQDTIPEIVKSYNGIKYNIWSAQSDLVLPYHGSNIETGIKFTNFDNNSDIDYYNFIQDKYTKDSSRSNLFDYNEKNLAGYISVQKDFDKKWSAKGGLRYEYSIIDAYSPTTGARNESEYGKLFPTAYITYKPDDSHTLSINYSKRINRPFFRALNPARVYSNPYTYYTGNPILLPSYSHNIELSYLYKGILSLSLYGEKLENGYGFIVMIDNPYKVTDTKNYLTQYNAGLTATLNLKILPWWENSSYAGFGLSDSRSSIADVVTQNGYSFNYGIYNTFSLNKIASMFVRFSQSLPSTHSNAYSANRYSLSSGFRVSLANKKFQFNATVNDLLKSDVDKGKIYFKDFTQYHSTYYDTRRLNLVVTYTFGKSKVRGNQKQINFKETQRAN